jgi:heat shock protein HtpX
MVPVMTLSRLNNQLKTVLLLGALSALIVGVGAAFAPGYVYLFAILALLMNLGSYFFSDRIVLALHRAQPIHRDQAPELYATVEELSHRAGIPMPRLFLIDDPQPNAFATGRNPAHGVVAVTSGILRSLAPRQLRGVLAHELAHIKNRDILVASIAAALASLVTWMAQALSFATIFGGRDGDEEGGFGGGGLLMAIVAPIGATLVQLGISRSREYLADETGALLTRDPEALASALLRLENAAHLIPPATASPATASLFIVSPLMRPGAVFRLFSTHPSTDERVARLRALGGRLRA